MIGSLVPGRNIAWSDDRRWYRERVSPTCQTNSRTREKINPLQTALSAGVGALTGGVMHTAGAAVRSLKPSQAPTSLAQVLNRSSGQQTASAIKPSAFNPYDTSAMTPEELAVHQQLMAPASSQPQAPNMLQGFGFGDKCCTGTCTRSIRSHSTWKTAFSATSRESA